MIKKTDVKKKEKTPTRKTTTKKRNATPRKRAVRKPPAIQQIEQPALVPEQPEAIDIEGLTTKQRVWAELYLACWNATDAARRAGYKDPDRSGYENRIKPEIKAYIDKRLAQHHMSADEVLARLSEMARGNMADFVHAYIDAESGRPEMAIDLEAAIRSGKMHLVKKVSITKEGESIELYDSKGALELLGKHYELFTDRHKHEGEVGARITNLNELLKLAGYGAESDA